MIKKIKNKIDYWLNGDLSEQCNGSFYTENSMRKKIIITAIVAVIVTIALMN